LTGIIRLEADRVSINCIEVEGKEALL